MALFHVIKFLTFLLDLRNASPYSCLLWSANRKKTFSVNFQQNFHSKIDCCWSNYNFHSISISLMLPLNYIFEITFSRLKYVKLTVQYTRFFNSVCSTFYLFQKTSSLTLIFLKSHKVWLLLSENWWCKRQI